MLIYINVISYKNHGEVNVLLDMAIIVRLLVLQAQE